MRKYRRDSRVRRQPGNETSVHKCIFYKGKIEQSLKLLFNAIGLVERPLRENNKNSRQ